MKTFSERFRWSRKQQGLSQDAVALECDVSQGLVSKIERGDQDATAAVTRFARLFQVDAHWLATGEGSAKTGGPAHLKAELSESTLSESQKRLLEAFDNMTESGKDDLIIALMGIAAGKTQR
jgi:transcriptional regulator with XRE-family HTH domain